MEELRGTAALDKEILSDAERQAARIIKAAEKTAREKAAANEQKLAAALEAETARFAAKTAERERELASRLVLDKQRVKIEKLDALLKTAAASFAASLTPEQKASFKQKTLETRARYAETAAGDSANYTLRYSFEDELDALLSEKREELAQALLGGDRGQGTGDSRVGSEESGVRNRESEWESGVRNRESGDSGSNISTNADSIVRTDILDKFPTPDSRLPTPDPRLPTPDSRLPTAGSITRVSGPIVHVEGLEGAGLFDMVEVGERRIIGEIVRIDGPEAVVQVYEDSTGLKTGAQAQATGRPLSVLLGPGLIGTIYDGIQRPLETLYEQDGAFMAVGSRGEPLDTQKRWHWLPDPALAARLATGERVNAETGLLLGTVKETESITCKIMVPPDTRGFLAELLPEGEYGVLEAVAWVEESGVRNRESGGSGSNINSSADSAVRTDIPANTPNSDFRPPTPDSRPPNSDSRFPTPDSRLPIQLAQWWPVRKGRPFARRLRTEEPLITGLRVVDLFFPLAKGGTAVIPGGFGTGKTMTQHAVAKWCDADVIVYIGCGERGNEMTEVLAEFPHLTDPRTGRSLMERTILIANTSNMPVAAREVSIYTGITMAEYYRDMGYHVAIMADSTSRWAEALRELSGRMEEMPAEEGFPAYLPTRLAEFYERAGRVETFLRDTGAAGGGGGNGGAPNGGTPNGGAPLGASCIGSVSIIGAVSPPGGDFSEPVTQHTKRFIRCFWALDRDLANARHYPAISWLDSYSEYAAELEDWWEGVNRLWASSRREALELLKKEQRLAEIVRLIGPDALPDEQKLILVTAEIIKNGFLQQNSFDDVDMFCAPPKQVALLCLFMDFYKKAEACLKLGAALHEVTAHNIRETFSRLKSEIRNDELSKIETLAQDTRKELDAIQNRYTKRASAKMA